LKKGMGLSPAWIESPYTQNAFLREK
jgi:hypothetical protein